MSAAVTMDEAPPLIGTCILCGSSLRFYQRDFHRELGVCPGCGINARMRGVVRAVVQAVYGTMDLPLVDSPSRPHVRMLGISDDARYASVLAAKFDYRNTFFHTTPRLDVGCEADCLAHAGHDVTICSDVLEHTIQRPFEVIRNLLRTVKPGGTLVISAPSFDMLDSIEWYGGIVSYEVTMQDGRPCVTWVNRRGQEFVDTAPIFHGGPGSTLEMRILAHCELIAAAQLAGAACETLSFAPKHGYAWPLAPISPYVDTAVDGRIIVCRPCDRKPQPSQI